MASVKKHLPALKLVQSAKPRLRKSILSNCDQELIKTILECIHNTLLGNIKLTVAEINKLKKFKAVLRRILNSSGNVEEKRNLIVQNGGSFLPVLLKPIVAAAHYTVKNEARTQNDSG